jgi:hypothetical protein
MRSRILIPALAISGVLVLAIVMFWPRSAMMSRNIGCAAAPSERGREICQALSDSMEWTWMGHAIVSPGWRVTWKALRRVYCLEKPTVADLEVLESLKTGSDWRLRDGADDLIRLVHSGGVPPYETANSIFNPTNSQYILKNGCEGEQ